MGTLATRHRLLVRLALAVGIAYVVWRGLFTLGGTDPVAAGVVFGAELIGLVVFAGRAWAASGPPAEWVDVPDVPLPDTTAVVDTSGATAEALRTTLVSMRRVAGIDRVVVVDPDGSRWARTVAERFDAVVCDPTVSVLEAARGAASPWVLVLRAGELPTPDLISMCAARCSSPTVGIVQTGRRESAPTSFEHGSEGYWSADEFEQEILRPSLAGRGSLPWYGDGPAMVRRAVLADVDPARRLPDDSRVVGLGAARSGMEVTHVPLTLARVPGPRGLGELLVRRSAAVRAGLRVIRPKAFAGVPRPTVLAHLLGAMPVLAALQRLLLVVASVLVLGFALVPVQAGAEFFVVALTAYALRWVAQRVLGRGRIATFSVLRNDLRSMATDLIPVRLSPRGAARLGVVTVTASMAVLLGTVVISGLALWHGWDRDIPAETTAVALALTAGLVGVAIEELLEQLVRRQRRDTDRVRLGLVTCRVEEHEGQLLDLSIGGVGVSLACPPIDAPAPGSVTTIAFRIPDADGAWRSVSALVHVAHRGADPEGGTRLGLAFDDPTDAPLDPVVEFLTVDRKLLAFGRKDPVP